MKFIIINQFGNRLAGVVTGIDCKCQIEKKQLINFDPISTNIPPSKNQNVILLPTCGNYYHPNKFNSEKIKTEKRENAGGSSSLHTVHPLLPGVV